MGVEGEPGVAIEEMRALAKLARQLWDPISQSIAELNKVNQRELSHENLRVINRAREALGGVVFKFHNLIDLFEYRSEEFSLLHKPFDVRASIGQLEQLLALKASQAGNELVVHIDDLVPKFLKGDLPRIFQVIANLLDRPLSELERGGVVVHFDVAAKAGDAITLRVSVSDTLQSNGDDEEMTFSSVSEAHAFMMRQYGADGISMAVAYQIVRELQGRLWVRRVAGKGTAFHFTAQLEDCSVKTSPQEQNQYLDRKLHSLRMLVVDDVEVNRSVLSKMLERDGHTVEVAESGFVAFEKIKSGIYDLVLMDISMPEMDGRDTTRLIRDFEAPLQRRTPVVAVSALSIDIEWEGCKEAGMDGYIQKPVSKSKLSDMLAQIFISA